MLLNGDKLQPDEPLGLFACRLYLPTCVKNGDTHDIHGFFFLTVFVTAPQLTQLWLEQADFHVVVIEILEGRGSSPLGILAVIFVRVENTLLIIYCFPVHSSSASTTNQAIN